MNREIKFRGQKVDTKEWIYGFYAEEPFIDKYGTLHIRDVRPTIDGIYVIPETVGQYTGLKDKNGKEIYEGDIVEKTYYSYHQPECSEIFKIIYNGFGFSFEHIKGRFYHTPFTEEIEVIGNIYENKELLEKIE